MVGVIIQSRMGSTRLPGKSLSELHGNPLLYYSVERAKKAKYVDQVIVATTTECKDDVIEEWCLANSVDYFRGNEEDVLDRYYQAALKYGFEVIVRATADNPFIDPIIIDLLITNLLAYNKDYITMRNKTNTWPYGLDIEVITFKALQEAWGKATTKTHREHVTMFIKENANLFQTLEIPLDKDLSNIRLTIDYQEDFDRAAKLMGDLLSKFGIKFAWHDVVTLYCQKHMVEKDEN